MSHKNRKSRSRRSSRNRSSKSSNRYTPVPRSKAKVGDIKSVSSDGRSRRYWTSRDLGASKSSSSKSSSSSSSGSTPVSQLSDDKKKQYISQLSSIRDQLVKLQAANKARSSGGSGSSKATSSYTGGSIVDYLGSVGQDSSFGNRSKLASQYGISNYTGTAAQNTQLLNTLRAGSASSNSGAGVPSTAVSSGLTTADVLDKRKQLEELKTQRASLEEQLSFLQNAADKDPFELQEGDKPLNPLNDPDTLISRYFSNDNYDLTKAEKERDRLLGQISDDTSDYYKNREKGLRDAYREFGVDEKTENLAKIQKEMAERQTKLREDTQRLETDASFRGVSRDFANDQRERIKSVGAFDMANLAIVESAYAGDLDRSRELAQSLVDDQFNAFTGQIESYKAQLQALMPQLNEDQKRRALAIELALDERARKIEQAKQDTELKYEYATLAAEMNAPLNVTKSILNATSADEAFMLAAPYMKEKQAITTASTGATRGSSTGAAVGGSGGDLLGISPFNGTLATLDITSSKTTNRELENAVREQFAPEFSARLFSVLTQEQLRDFLAKYDAYQRSQGMNTDPEQALNEYLQYIGKSSTSSGGSTTDSSSTMDRAANFY